MKHKHYNEIVAWANGETIEFRAEGEKEWEPLGIVSSVFPGFLASYEYRVKPKPRTVNYRLWLDVNGKIQVTQGENELIPHPVVKWLTPWNQIEV